MLTCIIIKVKEYFIIFNELFVFLPNYIYTKQ